MDCTEILFKHPHIYSKLHFSFRGWWLWTVGTQLIASSSGKIDVGYGAEKSTASKFVEACNYFFDSYGLFMVDSVKSNRVTRRWRKGWKEWKSVATAKNQRQGRRRKEVFLNKNCHTPLKQNHQFRILHTNSTYLFFLSIQVFLFIGPCHCQNNDASTKHH